MMAPEICGLRSMTDGLAGSSCEPVASGQIALIDNDYNLY